MILSAHALLQHTHTPSREEIVEAISGNICRCTGYGQIVEAVQFAADRLQKSNALQPKRVRAGQSGAGHDAPEEGVLEAAEADAPTEIVR
jgi:carbon-monoxide dehydrogenase small subunit